MVKKFDFDIWPKAKMSVSDFVGLRSSHRIIEDFFEQRYDGVSAVLMPSGRSALHLILKSLGLSRPDQIWIPQFSSHCVINTVGYVGTPVRDLSGDVKAAVCFHQWGFPKKIPTSATVIEDSVDSLITSSAGLFPNDGRFEVLSLTKIFGAIAGGIILCQNKGDAEELRRARVSKGGPGWPHFALGLLGRFNATSHAYWSTVEPLNRYTPLPMINSIWTAIQSMDRIIEDRRKKIAYLQKTFGAPIAPLGESRLPVCWPVDLEDNRLMVNLPRSAARFMLPARGEDELRQVFLIPINHQVSLSLIETVLR